jgi:hypothetical protein
VYTETMAHKTQIKSKKAAKQSKPKNNNGNHKVSVTLPEPILSEMKAAARKYRKPLAWVIRRELKRKGETPSVAPKAKTPARFKPVRLVKVAPPTNVMGLLSTMPQDFTVGQLLALGQMVVGITPQPVQSNKPPRKSPKSKVDYSPVVKVVSQASPKGIAISDIIKKTGVDYNMTAHMIRAALKAHKITRSGKTSSTRYHPA